MSTTTVTLAAITDLAGQIWAGATVNYSIDGNGPFFLSDGTDLPSQYLEPQTITLDSTGTGTFNVVDSATIIPFNSLWKVTINPNSTAKGITFLLLLTGTTDNITAIVNAGLAGININPSQIPATYSDTEVVGPNFNGQLYFNTGADLGLRVYTNGAWSAVGGGSGGGITQLTGDVLAGPGSGSVMATCVQLTSTDDTGNATFSENLLQISTPDVIGFPAVELGSDGNGNGFIGISDGTSEISITCNTLGSSIFIDSDSATLQSSSGPLNLAATQNVVYIMDNGNFTDGRGFLFQPSSTIPSISLIFENAPLAQPIDLSNNGNGIATDEIVPASGALSVSGNVSVSTSGKGVRANYLASIHTQIASASTIAPTSTIITVTGTSAISTITVPSIMIVGGILYIIPAGVFTTTITGNIANAVTAVVGTMLTAVFDGTKWYIK